MTRQSATCWLALAALGAVGCPVDDRLLGPAKLDEGDAGDSSQASSGSSGRGGGNEGGDGTLAGGDDAGGAAGKHPGKGGSAGSSVSSGGDGPVGNGGTSTAGGTHGESGAGGGGVVSPAEVCKEDVNANGVYDCEENLLANGTFDSDTSEWLQEIGATVERAAGNAPGSGAGSLAVTNTTNSSSTSYSMNGAKQCIAATAETAYQVIARTHLADGALGAAGVSIWFYSAANCNGTLIQALSVPQSSVMGDWSTVSKDFTSPSGVASMLVRVVAVKKYSDPALTVRFDNVLLKPQ